MRKITYIILLFISISNINAQFSEGNKIVEFEMEGNVESIDASGFEIGFGNFIKDNILLKGEIEGSLKDIGTITLSSHYYTTWNFLKGSSFFGLDYEIIQDTDNLILIGTGLNYNFLNNEKVFVEAEIKSDVKNFLDEIYFDINLIFLIGE
tara:strand:- start:906 stop:1358 length:453 start_codon:yes stop_codon:yes gene_type:complete